MKNSSNISLLRYCGYTQAQIGEKLNLSQQTISHHLRRLRERSMVEGPMKIFLEGINEIQESKIIIGENMENLVIGRRNKNDFYYEGEGVEIKRSQGFPDIFEEKIWEIYQKKHLNISTQNEALMIAKNQTEIMEKIIQELKNLKNDFDEMKLEVNRDVGNDKNTC